MMLTDAKIKDLVAQYIINGYEDDNADCLHEVDEFIDSDDLARAYQFYRKAIVTVTFQGDLPECAGMCR